MMLRPRQKQFVERSLRALGEHGNTLGVAPTGAGKTVMLSAAVGEHIGSSAAKNTERRKTISSSRRAAERSCRVGVGMVIRGL